MRLFARTATDALIREGEIETLLQSKSLKPWYLQDCPIQVFTVIDPAKKAMTQSKAVFRFPIMIAAFIVGVLVSEITLAIRFTNLFDFSFQFLFINVLLLPVAMVGIAIAALVLGIRSYERRLLLFRRSTPPRWSDVIPEEDADDVQT